MGVDRQRSPTTQRLTSNQSITLPALQLRSWTAWVWTASVHQLSITHCLCLTALQ